MSFFDRQGIPEYLIRPHFEADWSSTSGLYDGSTDEETSEPDTRVDFEDDIATLRDYSFISISETGTFFMMHRLVQLTTRAWLKSHKLVDQWRNKFVGILYHEFPAGQYENSESCRSLFPTFDQRYRSSLKKRSFGCNGPQSFIEVRRMHQLAETLRMSGKWL